MEFKCENQCKRKSERCVEKGLAAAQLTLTFSVLLLLVLSPAKGFASDTSKILQQCRDLSLADDDIHNCLDNYLDVMDANLADISDLIRLSLIHI